MRKGTQGLSPVTRNAAALEIPDVRLYGALKTECKLHATEWVHEAVMENLSVFLTSAVTPAQATSLCKHERFASAWDRKGLTLPLC
jgi:hypothetical protein